MDLVDYFNQRDVFEDQTIEGAAAPGLELAGKEFYRCTFRRVKMPESLWRGTHLEDCNFEEAELTRMQPAGLVLRDVAFRGCKLLGTDWTNVGRNPQLCFTDCDLRYASFVGTCLRRTPFLRCKAIEANFIETDLTDADFTGTDLSGSVFERATLCNAKLAGASGVYVDPTKNRVKGAVISAESSVLLALSLGFLVDGYD